MLRDDSVESNCGMKVFECPCGSLSLVLRL